MNRLAPFYSAIRPQIPPPFTFMKGRYQQKPKLSKTPMAIKRTGLAICKRYTAILGLLTRDLLTALSIGN